MGKQHLDARSVATGLFEGLCASEPTGYIADTFINAAWDLAGRLLWPRMSPPLPDRLRPR